MIGKNTLYVGVRIIRKEWFPLDELFLSDASVRLANCSCQTCFEWKSSRDEGIKCGTLSKPYGMINPETPGPTVSIGCVRKTKKTIEPGQEWRYEPLDMKKVNGVKYEKTKSHIRSLAS
ncbi:hypothetical protein VTL71DRAFT_6958 [Oculimacula yallundae]|uniref:Uncharacterized protein n=1 Tax=Oculimacula yallundae TaxID=86028 RepID=A0ABR4BWH4_9HELO